MMKLPNLFSKPFTPVINRRSLGLDVVRTIAIFCVLISHGRIFIQNYINVKVLTFGGAFGVELFFVLSGFLVGKIIITQMLNDSSWKGLIYFYIKRWLRTIPLYYSILLLIMFNNQLYHWQNFIFLQNFNKDLLNIFPVSWSLSIEEWFYLLFPLFLLLTIKYFKIINLKNLIIQVCLTIIVLEMLLKCLYVEYYNPTFDFGTRMQIPLHFGSIMFGVLISSFKFFKKEAYERLKYILLGMSLISFLLLILIIIFYYLKIMNNLDHSYFARTFFLPVLGIESILIVIIFDLSPLIHNLNSNQYIRRLFKFFSITSYSVYLLHYQIYHYVFIQYHSSSLFTGVMLWLGTLCIIYLCAVACYIIIEKPFLFVRNALV